MDYISIRCGVANASAGSLCQIGLVHWNANVIIDKELFSINPDTLFVDNDRCHYHYDSTDFKDEVEFPLIYSHLERKLKGKVVVYPNPFDKAALDDMCVRYKLPLIKSEYINLESVSRRAWEDVISSGYGLNDVASMIDITLADNTPVDGAEKTGLVFLKAFITINKTLPDLIKWLSSGRIHAPKANPNGLNGELLIAPDLDKVENKHNPFFGKRVTVSGTYDKWPVRKDLASLLKTYGAKIDKSVLASTDILCAGKGVGPSKLDKMNNKEGGLVLSESDIIDLLG